MCATQAEPSENMAPAEASEQSDFRRRAIAVGLELAKNATRARTLDELQFILVNDTRALLPFDRCMLITHFNGKSALLAVNNQPKLEKKSGFVEKTDVLAPKLKNINTALILPAGSPMPADLTEEQANALRDYVSYSECRCLILIPLSQYDNVVGHLLMEFFGDRPPGDVEILTLMNMLPFLSAALAEKWVLANENRARRYFLRAVAGGSASEGKRRSAIKAAILAILTALIVVGLWLPVTLKIGGRVEVIPDYEYLAYVQMDGIVDKVLVKEGDRVKRDQILGVLESKEIDYKIREAERLRESYKAEMEILRNMGAENPSKLAESQLVAIKSLRAKHELEFLDWQRRFLNVKSPVEGIILTKKIEALIGKRFKAGEPFCKVAPETVLAAEVFVKESDVAYVQQGQIGEAFFNFRPDESYPLKVKSIAPKAETLERLGGIYRVRADFSGRPPDLKPGMLGVARIDTREAALWFVVTRRIKARISEFLLQF